MPTGAVTRQVVDVDGDGRPDTAWMSQPDPDTGLTTFGITTAAGGGATTPFESASPVERSALVVDADGRPPVEIILSDGRSAHLEAFADCSIQPVRNPQGQTYAFDLGDRIGTGTGVGCVRTSEGQRLVGLNKTVSADGATVDWTRTTIELDGLHARNGATTKGTFHLPADQAKAELLDQITCGSETIQADGVTSTD